MFPHIVRQVPHEQFVDQVDGPENIVPDQQQDGMVVIPTDHQGIESQDKIDDAFVPVVHTDPCLVVLKIAKYRMNG
jgi:hypothetical protein